MKILLIDTCAVQGSVALANDLNVLETIALGERKSSEDIMPAIRRLLEQSGWVVGDLDAVGVVRGPGSFTRCPNRMERRQRAVRSKRNPPGGRVASGTARPDSGVEQLVSATLDAGRDQFYVARWSDGLMEWQRLLSREDLELERGRWIACEPKVADALGIEAVAEPDAGAALALVLCALARGVDHVVDDAIYLRQTDAELFAKPATR